MHSQTTRALRALCHPATRDSSMFLSRRATSLVIVSLLPATGCCLKQRRRRRRLLREWFSVVVRIRLCNSLECLLASYFLRLAVYVYGIVGSRDKVQTRRQHSLRDCAL